MRSDGEPPAVLVGIDTEADDQWSAEGRRRLSVRNALRLPALQALCDRFGVRPSYLVTHEMAARKESADVLRGLAREGRCEIGAHLHPWTSPPFRPEDVARHTYPHNLPVELLERQLTDLAALIAQELGVRPTTYRAGRNGFDGGSLPILEVPISAATSPALPKAAEALYARLRPIPWRGALRRLGLKAVWLRPSYAALPDMLAFASRLARARVPCFNIIFHSSELLPGGSPYTPDEASVSRFLEDLKRLFEHLTARLGAVGRTYGQFRAEWDARA